VSCVDLDELDAHAGIERESMVLLNLMVLCHRTLVLRTGRTIILNGVVLLMVFAVFLFTTCW